jgi:hypothetical protein
MEETMTYLFVPLEPEVDMCLSASQCLPFLLFLVYPFPMLKKTAMYSSGPLGHETLRVS